MAKSTLVTGFLLVAVLLQTGFSQEAANPTPLEQIMTVIPSPEEEGETYSGPRPIVEIVNGIPGLDWTPNFDPKSNTLFEKAQKVVFRRSVKGLEFSFLPVRMVSVDIPQPTGKMQRKLIWYLVYRVRNTSRALNPQAAPDGTFNVEPWSFSNIRFLPHFVLSSHEYQKEYLDRVLPAAQRVIQAREDHGHKLHNSVEMARQPIPAGGPGVWGVATWESVDPRIDYFSIYVRGLTNAFRFVDPPNGFQQGDPIGKGRQFTYKTLQLNFWRPGDQDFEHEREFRYGVPIDTDPLVQQQVLGRYGLERRLDHQWLYR